MKLASTNHDHMLPLAVAIVSALGVIMLGMGQRDLQLSVVALLAVGASFVLTDMTGWLRLNRTTCCAAQSEKRLVEWRPARAETVLYLTSARCVHGRARQIAEHTALHAT